MGQLRTFSYGGGVQSTAALVLAAQGVIDFPVFLFANVGDDSEDPLTLAYIEAYAKPYAALHGIQLHELHKVRQRGAYAGQVETLYSRLTRPGGASPDSPATVGIGISLDEIHRVNKRKAMPYERPVYPLLDHKPPLRRYDCERIIRAAGLPVPPKSSCWFCPFHQPLTWSEMRRDRPELFQRACNLEALLNERRDQLGKDHVYLTRFNAPLSRAIGEAGPTLNGLDDADDDAECDNGACFT